MCCTEFRIRRRCHGRRYIVAETPLGHSCRSGLAGDDTVIDGWVLVCALGLLLSSRVDVLRLTWE